MNSIVVASVIETNFVGHLENRAYQVHQSIGDTDPERSIFEGKDIPLFIFLFDIAYGASMTVRSILIAGKTLNGDLEKEMSKAIGFVAKNRQESLGIDMSIVQQASNYLLFMEFAKKATALFIEDPSGQLLIDKYVKSIDNKKQRGYFSEISPVAFGHIKEFVILGADYTQKLYQALYPYTQK